MPVLNLKFFSFIFAYFASNFSRILQRAIILSAIWEKNLLRGPFDCKGLFNLPWHDDRRRCVACRARSTSGHACHHGYYVPFEYVILRLTRRYVPVTDYREREREEFQLYNISKLVNWSKYSFHQCTKICIQTRLNI